MRKFYFIGIVLLFICVRFFGLDYDMSNSDALRWHRRTENFTQALKNGDIASTYQHYQPGVTLMWFNSSVKYITKYFSSVFFPGLSKENLSLENSDYYPLADGLSKRSLVLLLASIFSLQLLFIKKLWGNRVTYFYGMLWALEPYAIGIDRWFHLTSLEVYFSFLAFLLVLLWAKNKNKLLLIFVGFFWALAFLSKTTSLVLGPLLIFIIFKSAGDTKDAFKQGFVVLGTFFISVFLLFPALWIDFTGVLSRLFGAISNAVSESGESFTLPWYFYLLSLLYKLSPLTLLVFLISLFNVKKNMSSNNRLTLIYFFMFLIILTISTKKIDRYLLAVMPPVVLLAAVFLSTLKKEFIYVYLSIFIGFSVFLLVWYYPVYSSYYSPVLGGTNGAIGVKVYDNSGEYFADSALYLNEKGRNIYVYVPDNIESFSPYFSGNLQREFTSETNYIVRSLDSDRSVLVESDCPNIEKSFGAYDKEIVFIYRCWKP